ncbi:hypothetical protein [Tenacibaculum sp. 190130A14a]|uniref:Lipoprotein n=1 Tax=Tenacibaculum polynesiense TaxID=3137857 RepID=A0ABM9PG49_9FLAO
MYKTTIFFQLVLLLIFIDCKSPEPSIEISTTEENEVVLWKSKKNNRFWAVSIPFKVIIKNTSNKEKILTYYEYECNKLNKCKSGFLYSFRDSIHIKETLGKKILNPKSTKKYLFYSKHILDSTLYPKDLFRDYLKINTIKNIDSIPIGTISKFKDRYPKLIENLFKNDSIYFRFLNINNKRYSDGYRLPIIL